MRPFDEEHEGNGPFGESSDVERDLMPDVPEVPSVKTFDGGGEFDAADVDAETLRAFGTAVIYANVALLLVFLGPMLWVFEGWNQVGPALLVVGILAGIRTYQTHRAWAQSRDSDDDHPEPPPDVDTASVKDTNATDDGTDGSGSDSPESDTPNPTADRPER